MMNGKLGRDVAVINDGVARFRVAVGLVCLFLGMLLGSSAHAQESVCARVKIEIKQELTLERQAFDAEMRITNSLPVTPLTQVEVEVRVTDETGAPVTITTDPNDLTAKFFIRQTHNDTAWSGLRLAHLRAVRAGGYLWRHSRSGEVACRHALCER